MSSIRWWMVLVAVLGLICGPGPINIFAFGVFMKPISEDLGVSRSLLTLALVTTTTTGAVVNPFFGWLIDRYGTRKTLLSIIPVFAASVAGYSLLTPAPAVIFAIFFAVGLTGTITGPVPYATLIARWFDRERGLALGIAMAGVGLGAALIPSLSAVLIAHFGWRVAYRGLAILVLVLAWLPAFFIRDPGPRDLARLSEARADGTLRGSSWREAVSTWRFWALTIAFFLAVVGINGTLAHTVALLTDRGVSVQVATSAIAVSGIAIIFGRILSGWCLDRFFGSYVAIAFFAIPMVGILLLGLGGSAMLALAGAALCGLSVGAEVDLMAFFVSRYFGLRSYGKVYGTMFAFFAAGNGVGPLIGGISFDRFHTYAPAFVVFEAALVVTCVLFARLGPYPYPSARNAAAGRVHKAPA